ncbi:MAG TPA: NAD(P)-binding domain-containing protein [Candidatus Deferrimicrobium sp.]|nr:NAD(P)-binding domain-containing protein [Candidatus Deferrimicrobium sp.]
MKIGIIGAGNIGTTLTRRLTALGHEVKVANSRGPETLTDLAVETGATAVPVTETVPGSEVVIVTIPEKSVPQLPHGLFDDARDDLVVIDTGNYYPQRDGTIDEIQAGTTQSRWVSQQLGRPVVKAFNSIRSQHLLERGQTAGSPGRIALPVAGDDADAKAVVMQLVDDLGFEAVDSGGLDDSWRHQPGTPAYAADLEADALRRALAEATR